MRGEKVINNDRRETQSEFRLRFRKLQKKKSAWLRIFAEYFLDPTLVDHRWRLETLRFTVNFVLEGSVFVAFFFPH